MTDIKFVSVTWPDSTMSKDVLNGTLARVSAWLDHDSFADETLRFLLRGRLFEIPRLKERIDGLKFPVGCVVPVGVEYLVAYEEVGSTRTGEGFLIAELDVNDVARPFLDILSGILMALEQRYRIVDASQLNTKLPMLDMLITKDEAARLSLMFKEYTTQHLVTRVKDAVFYYRNDTTVMKYYIDLINELGYNVSKLIEGIDDWVRDGVYIYKSPSVSNGVYVYILSLLSGFIHEVTGTAPDFKDFIDHWILNSNAIGSSPLPKYPDAVLGYEVQEACLFLMLSSLGWKSNEFTTVTPTPGVPVIRQVMKGLSCFSVMRPDTETTKGKVTHYVLKDSRVYLRKIEND
jgi:hypothetical protein